MFMPKQSSSINTLRARLHHKPVSAAPPDESDTNDAGAGKMSPAQTAAVMATMRERQNQLPPSKGKK